MAASPAEALKRIRCAVVNAAAVDTFKPGENYAYEEITLLKDGEIWKIADTVPADREDTRKWTQYDIAMLAENQPTITQPDEASKTSFGDWK
ncbi:hypothetical protein [Glutamicibacter ardleyensis]|uniref:hypothetical protein n=1 Tax=Glutamicibacter ardleyensis TaxID=225894 RepID=UPI003FD4B187